MSSDEQQREGLQAELKQLQRAPLSKSGLARQREIEKQLAEIRRRERGAQADGV